MVTECIYGRKKRVGGESDTPGGFTRVIQSRLPVSKKEKKGEKKKERERGKEKTSTSPSKTRGGKRENFIFP